MLVKIDVDILLYYQVNNCQAFLGPINGSVSNDVVPVFGDDGYLMLHQEFTNCTVTVLAVVRGRESMFTTDHSGFSIVDAHTGGSGSHVRVSDNDL